MNYYHHYKDMGRPIELLIEYWAKGWSDDPAEKEKYDWAHVEFSFDVEDDPERAWQCILLTVNNSLCEKHFGVLAAGPLESFLSYHGKDYIDRVEMEAASNPKFAFLLGGVWKDNIADDIWDRVQKVWDRRGWDGIPRDA